MCVDLRLDYFIFEVNSFGFNSMWHDLKNLMPLYNDKKKMAWYAIHNVKKIL